MMDLSAAHSISLCYLIALSRSLSISRLGRWNVFAFVCFVSFFFFQAEDGIRDHCVTGVQTCALPISVLFLWIQPGAAATGCIQRNRTAPTIARIIITRCERRLLPGPGRPPLASRRNRDRKSVV